MSIFALFSTKKTKLPSIFPSVAPQNNQEAHAEKQIKAAADITKILLKKNQELFLKIKVEEFFAKKEDQQPNLIAFYHHQDMLVQSIIADVLNHDEFLNRAQAIERWIKIMMNAYAAKDMSLFIAIKVAMQSSLIANLHKDNFENVLSLTARKILERAKNFDTSYTMRQAVEGGVPYLFDYGYIAFQSSEKNKVRNEEVELPLKKSIINIAKAKQQVLLYPNSAEAKYNYQQAEQAYNAILIKNEKAVASLAYKRKFVEDNFKARQEIVRRQVHAEPMNASVVRTQEGELTDVEAHLPSHQQLKAKLGKIKKKNDDRYDVLKKTKKDTSLKLVNDNVLPKNVESQMWSNKTIEEIFPLPKIPEGVKWGDSKPKSIWAIPGRRYKILPAKDTAQNPPVGPTGRSP